MLGWEQQPCVMTSACCYVISPLALSTEDDQLQFARPSAFPRCLNHLLTDVFVFLIIIIIICVCVAVRKERLTQQKDKQLAGRRGGGRGAIHPSKICALQHCGKALPFAT